MKVQINTAKVAYPNHVVAYTTDEKAFILDAGRMCDAIETADHIIAWGELDTASDKWQQVNEPLPNF